MESLQIHSSSHLQGLLERHSQNVVLCTDRGRLDGHPSLQVLAWYQRFRGISPEDSAAASGFSISPRYAIALLYEFVHRWNHDVDVRILGLDSKYSHFYDGWVIEQEIEVTCTWEELLESPHSTWELTGNFASTEEDFGLVSQASLMVHLVPNDLKAEMVKIVDAYEDGTLDDSNDDLAEVAPMASQQLPASAAWVANKLGRKRGFILKASVYAGGENILQKKLLQLVLP
jgi:hypothetical protein